MRARCKFTVHTAEGAPGTPGQYDEQKVLMHTQYDENDPEDTKFSAATPWGTLEFGISNPNLAGFFVPGKTYFVDITPCEDEAAEGQDSPG